MFTASKRELGELYTFFRLLAQGHVYMGNAQGEKDETQCRPIAYIQRAEHDGARRYHLEDDQIRVEYGSLNRQGHFEPSEVCTFQDARRIPRDDFQNAADYLLSLLKGQSGEEVEVPDEFEAFLDDVCIYDLEAKTDDRTDLSIAFWHVEAPLSGFVVRCKLSPMNPLLDGGRTANLKFEQTGVKFAVPTVNKINALPESPTEVTDRMLLIERLGGVLKYADVADRVFRANLQMIDLHFPRMLAEITRLLHLEGITRTHELVARIIEINPLKIKDELIQKHHFYEYKMKQFLLALLFGMRPAKIFNGTDSAIQGMLLTDGQGDIIAYHQSQREVLAQYLYTHTRFEKGPVEKDKYGFLERENGVYYFKLNAKIGLVKR